MLGAQRHQPIQRGGHVVDVPVDDHAARACGKLGRGKPPVDDAQLVLVVADAELDVARPAPGGLAGEVRFDAGRRETLESVAIGGELDEASRQASSDATGDLTGGQTGEHRLSPRGGPEQDAS